MASELHHRFRLYDTLRRETVPFEPRRAGHVGIYVCGMTVYDHAHVGHARAMVVFDAFVRYLRHRGWEVTYVRNYTDVDDKIIRRANDAGEDPLSRAQRYVDAFREDMAALGLLPPDEEPQVTSCIDEIVALIGELVDRGHAYADSGNVWFSVESYEAYGALSRQRLDRIEASADSQTGKRDPRDFALWKSAKRDEPSWPSPWGPGRPGWHIECSAMSHETLGRTLDIHGGGADLVFPHHENERAQSESVHGSPFASVWMHNGLLTTSGGAKIARSEGNGATIREVLTSMPAEALRIYYLQAHYRSPLAWEEHALRESLVRLARLYGAMEAASSLNGDGTSEEAAARLGDDARAVLELARAFQSRLHAALDDDFNTARALAHAFDLARATNRFAAAPQAKRHGGPVAREALAAMHTLRDALGLLRATPEDFYAEVAEKRFGANDRQRIEHRLADRERARARRDYAEADRIRTELESTGLSIRDTPEGPRWRVVF